jgi:type II secretory pathway pseudopilin PulG
MIELMIVVLIISLLAALAIPAYSRVLRTSRRSALIADGRELYSALMRYHVDEGNFPSESNPPETRLDTQTLSPLSTNGYFNNVTGFTSKLIYNRLLIYLAPDVGAANTQFLTLFRSAVDPSITVIVAPTNLLLTPDGKWLDGVYLISNGSIVPADEGE